MSAAPCERTEWEATACTAPRRLTRLFDCCLLWSEEDIKEPQGEKMEDESRRKMKEKFGLRRDIFKEFLAEFLGIFILIVSTLSLPPSLAPSAPVIQLKEPLWNVFKPLLRCFIYLAFNFKIMNHGHIDIKTSCHWWILCFCIQRQCQRYVFMFQKWCIAEHFYIANNNVSNIIIISTSFVQ